MKITVSEKKTEAAGRRTLGEVDTYEIIGVSKDGDEIQDFKPIVCNNANELYKTLDGITGESTKGKLTIIEEHPQSAIEGDIDLGYTGKESTWTFDVWFTLYFTDPVATAITDLGL